MEPKNTLPTSRGYCRSIVRALRSAIPILVIGISGQAFAQTALDTANAAPQSGQATNLKVIKRANGGGFVITVTNVGTETASNVLVTDMLGKGRKCPAENAVIIAGQGTPTGSFTLADLSGAGITLGTLNSGQSATFTYSCQAN
jgi:hypothetical protein